MNAIEILGSLLGGSKGGGAEILTEILGGSRPSGAPGRSSSQTNSRSARDLEDMLGVGGGGPASSPATPRSNPTRVEPRPTSPVSAPAAPTGGFPGDIFGQRPRQTQISLAIARPAQLSQNDQAVLMIRAMINSAKVDGEISQEEQQFILERVSDTSQETVQFLRSEFARPLNVKEFSNEVPVGLEQSVYLLSLMAIKLDTKAEADYLRSLATALRLSPDTINQIHQQQNAPVLYNN